MNPKITILPLMLWRIGFWGNAKILLAPRGEFGGGALGRRSFKKRAYIALFRALRIHRSTIWHSTASHETADIRRLWGDQASIIERENETMLSAHARPPLDVDVRLRTIFLGRIVEHKGLEIALNALAAVEAPVLLDVYGSREDEEYAARCESLAVELPSNVVVKFHGPIAPERTVDVLAEHDVLLMPTAGENFGHVIAESLSASCFVVTTTHTPWTARFSAGGGVALDRSPSTWADVIQRLASDGADQRLARRRAAGDTYEAWLASPRPPHVWTLALDRIAEQRRPLR